jgi:phosphatidate cytidylyltransferase
MLSTRLWMGTLLVAVACALLAVDYWWPPWYPGLFVLYLAVGCVTTSELLHLLRPLGRPPGWLVYLGVTALAVANWLPHLPVVPPPLQGPPWPWLVGTFVAFVLAVFLVEMQTYREAGTSVHRMSVALWAVCYLALLPSFFAQLRWLGNANQSTVALALAIFVPKCCDIGAYTAGRLFGRHPMTPLLSPKKTWEGAAGGVALAVAATFAIDRLSQARLLQGLWWAEVGFGVTVGVAGMLGDLAESLVKRDCQRKDAAQTVPGFGGVLDVVDAVLFSAPVAFCWLHLLRVLAPAGG